jgi:hypothetical protein
MWEESSSFFPSKVIDARICVMLSNLKNNLLCQDRSQEVLDQHIDVFGLVRDEMRCGCCFSKMRKKGFCSSVTQIYNLTIWKRTNYDKHISMKKR